MSRARKTGTVTARHEAQQEGFPVTVHPEKGQATITPCGMFETREDLLILNADEPIEIGDVLIILGMRFRVMWVKRKPGHTEARVRHIME